ncbi:MAG: sigma-70 family RNA polymerase sigma factor [Muribaculaceae bacterium]|nr:sigma-70 family RNA polymerase sigma factor [Muribaculaceae bacterium]
MNDILTTVFGRIRHRLHLGAARLLQSEQEADDALQEAFVRLWQRRDSFQGEEQTEGAAVVTVRNICIDELRRRSLRLETQSAAYAARSEAEEPDDCLQDVVCEVKALIETELSSRDRDILLMRDRNGYDFDEIAAEFGMTEAAVRMALSRARKTIRNIYRTRYGQ